MSRLSLTDEEHFSTFAFRALEGGKLSSAQIKQKKLYKIRQTNRTNASSKCIKYILRVFNDTFLPARTWPRLTLEWEKAI